MKRELPKRFHGPSIGFWVLILTLEKSPLSLRYKDFLCPATFWSPVFEFLKRGKGNRPTTVAKRHQNEAGRTIKFSFTEVGTLYTSS